MRPRVCLQAAGLSASVKCAHVCDCGSPISRPPGGKGSIDFVSSQRRIRFSLKQNRGGGRLCGCGFLDETELFLARIAIRKRVRESGSVGNAREREVSRCFFFASLPASTNAAYVARRCFRWLVTQRLFLDVRLSLCIVEATGGLQLGDRRAAFS